MKRQKFKVELNIAHWHKEIYVVQNQDLQTGVSVLLFFFFHLETYYVILISYKITWGTK